MIPMLFQKKSGEKGMNSPAEIAAGYVEIGKKKAALPLQQMFLLAMFAGAFIAFGALGSQMASLLIQPPSFGRFLGAWVFPTGLLLVLIAGAELFTGNCLLVVPLLQREITAAALLRSWIVVFAGNLIGGILIAAAVTKAHLLSQCDGALLQSVIATASAKSALSFTDAFIRGILCNILVCLAVWVSFASKDVAGKITAMYFPIMVFVISGYEHSVANAYFIPAGIFAAGEYGVLAEGLGWGAFFLNNLLPVTLGNIVGGVIVGSGYWMIYLKGKK